MKKIKRSRKPNNQRSVRHPIKTFKQTTKNYQEQAAENYRRIKKSDAQHQPIDERKVVKQSISQASDKQLWGFGIFAAILFIFIICSLFM